MEETYRKLAEFSVNKMKLDRARISVMREDELSRIARDSVYKIALADEEKLKLSVFKGIVEAVTPQLRQAEAEYEEGKLLNPLGIHKDEAIALRASDLFFRPVDPIGFNEIDNTLETNNYE